MSTSLTLADYVEIGNVAFDWSESYDTKDWDRLRSCLAPSVNLDFRGLKGELHENLSPDQYVAILSSPKLLGDNRLKTQHLLSGGKWESQSNDMVHVSYKARVAHQRFDDENMSNVLNKGHGHGVAQIWYKKTDGAWKIVAVQPGLTWAEYDLFGTLSPPEENGAK